MEYLSGFRQRIKNEIYSAKKEYVSKDEAVRFTEGEIDRKWNMVYAVMREISRDQEFLAEIKGFEGNFKLDKGKIVLEE